MFIMATETEWKYNTMYCRMQIQYIQIQYIQYMYVEWKYKHWSGVYP